MSFFQKNTITSIFHYFPKCGTFFLILLSIFLFNTQVSFADFDITEEQCVAIGTSSGTGTSACEWTSCNTDNGTQAYVGRCYQESKQFCCLTYTSGTTPSPDTCKNKLGGTCSGKAECPSKQLQIGTCSADGKDFCCKNTDPDPNDTPATSISSFKYTPLEPIPGAEGIDGSTLAGFLQSLYVFALWSAGVMAMFMIGIGGFWYLTSAGSTARVASAKTIITNALVGLLVLMFTWLILYVINPDLTKLDWTSLEKITIPKGENYSQQDPGPGTGGGGGGDPVSDGSGCNGYVLNANKESCKLISENLASFLQCVRGKVDSNIKITITSITSNGLSPQTQEKSALCCGHQTSPCPHSATSCHHGCKASNKGQSYAVDFAMSASDPNYCTIAQAAVACGAKEKLGPKTACGVSYASGHNSHFHFSSSGCD